LKDEITEKKSHIHVLEQRMVQSLETTEDPANKTELSQVMKWLRNDEPKSNFILV
jgi:centromeric protein E